MRNLQSCIAAWSLFAIPFSVLAQLAVEYPAKPVRVIVAAGPGGGADLQSRMYAQKLGESMKRTFVIENRPGGGGTIGQAAAAQAAPDGYTLLTIAPAFTYASALYPSLPFDPAKSFAPISLAHKSASMLLVHHALPVKSVKELITLARSKPGVLDMAVTYGTTNHLFAAYFMSMANIKVTFIPYKGGQQDAMDIIAGQVQMVMGSVFSYLPLVRSGKLRALGVTTSERTSILPEVPTLSEAGVRGYEASSWHGWVAPAGTPAAILGKLAEELAKAVKSPDIVKKLAEDGGIPVGSTPEQFRDFLAVETPRWQKVARESGFKVE